jgi:hypothetical protein
MRRSGMLHMRGPWTYAALMAAAALGSVVCATENGVDGALECPCLAAGSPQSEAIQNELKVKSYPEGYGQVCT